MATIVQCHPVRQPSGRISGSRPNVYTAQWVVAVDDQIDMTSMIFLATNVAAAPAAPPIPAIKPIPLKGSFFTWTSPGGVRRVDKSSLLLDIDSTELLDDGKKWIVDVRWRAPVPGADEEPDRVNVPPLKRPPYYWVEYYTETEEIFDAQPTIPIGPSSDPKVFRPAGVEGAGSITTAAGEETDLAVDERLHIVLVSEKYVSSPRVSVIINSLFFGKLNSNLWRIPPVFTGVFDAEDEAGRVFKKHARFLRSETSQYGEWFDGEQYFKMQTRVRIAALPFFKQVPNRGTLFYNPITLKVEVARDDNAVLRKVNLKQDGTKDDSNKPFLIPYQIAGDRTFTNRSTGFV